jgi:hypothetical protein
MFAWADDVEPDHPYRVGVALDALATQVPEIRNYVHGADVGVSEGNFDYVLVADFDNVNDWRTYRDHPQHVLFLAEHIKGKVKHRAAVQFQTAPTDRTAHDVSAAGIEELLAQFDELG